MGRRISLVLLLSAAIFGGFCLKGLAKNPRPADKWQRFGPGTSECQICSSILSYWNDPASTLNRKVEITANEIKISYTTQDSFRIPEAEIVCDATWKTWKTFKVTKRDSGAINLCPLCKKVSSFVRSGAKITVLKINEGCLATVSFVEERKSPSEVSVKKVIDSLPEKASTSDTMYEAVSPIRHMLSNSILNPPGARKAEIVGAAPSTLQPPVRHETKQLDSIPLSTFDDVPPDQNVDQKPSLIRKAEPNYPPIAFANRIEGRVVLAILLDVDGKVLSVKVANSTNEIFNQDAIICAKQWTFKPAILNGNPIKFWYTDSLDFRIK
ncbi:MAG: energy transducer TonB [candidate division Zixibacteria bacterium]|nr:energy transducer TonB [candidate division Zixibacteria bacterium]